MMHHSRLRALSGPCFWSISLVLTCLQATNCAKVFTLEGALDFQMKLVGSKGREEDQCEKAVKKVQTENKPDEVKDQTLMSRLEGDRYTWDSSDTVLLRTYC